MPERWWIAAALVLAVAACDTADSASGPTAGGDVHQLASRTEQLARERYAESYAGLELADGRVVLYRKPDASLDAALRALPGGASLVLRDAPHSARELERLRDDVFADIDHWRRRGITVSSVAVRHDGTAVEVGTAQVALARRELPARYGAAAPLEIVAAGPIAVVPS